MKGTLTSRLRYTSARQAILFLSPTGRDGRAAPVRAKGVGEGEADAIAHAVAASLCRGVLLPEHGDRAPWLQEGSTLTSILSLRERRTTQSPGEGNKRAAQVIPI